tara:strand:- start:815 stop:1006 length:192 start_codon:yes stop_codon:yes gene_type:complete
VSLFDQLDLAIADRILDDNQAAFDAHFKTEYFQALGASVQGEGLVSAPLDIKTIKPIGGFAAR